jgi:hypothetical protein
MMIIYDETIDEHFEILICFRNVVGPLGHVLASSLVPKKLSRPSDDQLFFIGPERAESSYCHFPLFE